jgi:hypothetical protein
MSSASSLPETHFAFETLKLSKAYGITISSTESICMMNWPNTKPDSELDYYTREMLSPPQVILADTFMIDLN